MLPTGLASTVAFEAAADADAEAEGDAVAEAEADAAVDADTAVEAFVVGDEPPLEHAASVVAATTKVVKVKAFERIVQSPETC
jgi:collagenase-like PrtC family protease